MTKIVFHYCAFKAAHRHERESRASRLWSEDYFSSLKLDKHSVDVKVLSRVRKSNKVFRDFKEGREKSKARNKMQLSQLDLCTSMVELNGLIHIIRTLLLRPIQQKCVRNEREIGGTT